MSTHRDSIQLENEICSYWNKEKETEGWALNREKKNSLSYKCEKNIAEEIE